MPTHDWVFRRRNDPRCITRTIAPGVVAEIFVGDQAMLSLVRLEPNAESQIHSHPEEQWGVMLEGDGVRIQGDAEASVQVGDFWLTPGTVRHALRAGAQGAVVLDIFSPPRAEYRGQDSMPEGDHVLQESLDVTDAIEFGAAALCDAAGGIGAIPSSIGALTSSNTVAGQALTVSCAPRNNYWIHQAVSAASEGDVLVVSTGQYRDGGYWGEILTRAALKRGIRGLVIDGCIRDLREVEQLGFPVFGTGTCICQTSKSAEPPGAIGRPLQIGECVIRTGDWIVGDRDGVMVLPRDHADTIYASARKRVSAEHIAVRRIESGASTLEIFGIPASGTRESTADSREQT